MPYNKCILLGNLTRDPEIRYTPKGTAVAKLGLALNHTWKDEAGTQHEEVTFVDCDCFGRTAEVIAQYFVKGKPILIEGRLKLDQWQDKQTNENRQKLKVVVERFSFVGGKDDAENGGNGHQAPPQRGNRPPARGQRAAAEAPQQDGGESGYHQDAEESEQVPF